jgi:hypothetical protein
MHLSVFLGPVSLGAAQDLPWWTSASTTRAAAPTEDFAIVMLGEQHFNGYEPYCNPFLMAARLSPHLGETYFGTTIVPPGERAPRTIPDRSSIRGRFPLATLPLEGHHRPVLDRGRFLGNLRSILGGQPRDHLVGERIHQTVLEVDGQVGHDHRR